MEVNLTILNEEKALNEKKSRSSAPLARRVLIVDDSSDSLDVLRTALHRRGVDTVTTRRATEGIDLARDFHPDLILLDLESVPSDRLDLRKNYDDAARRENAPLILVARGRRDPAAAGGQHVVSKPYHYAPLIRKIEELLGPSEHQRAA
jgi:DNA-binding response OmpR family regulator